VGIHKIFAFWFGWGAVEGRGDSFGGAGGIGSTWGVTGENFTTPAVFPASILLLRENSERGLFQTCDEAQKSGGAAGDGHHILFQFFLHWKSGF